MGETKEKLLPGTSTTYVDHGEKGFSKIEMLLAATGGLTLSQVCAVTGLEGSTIQNWVKRGWVANPMGKKYEEVHIARILIINALKECIKLEHISHLMRYVNDAPEDSGVVIIKESDLYNYLCDALDRMGRTNENSRSGVETVVETILSDYIGPSPEYRVRIRKALTLMIYACVCTDVKRRTEAMMGRILHELEHPDQTAPEVPKVEAFDSESPPAKPEPPPEIRKTVSQALREWEVSSVERIIIDHEEIEQKTSKPNGAAEKTVNRPWFSRRGSRW